MFTRAFWAAALERALKSAAQAAITFWAIGDGLLNLWTVDAKGTGGVMAGMFVLSLVMSVASIPFSASSGPSLTKSEVLNPERPTEPSV